MKLFLASVLIILSIPAFTQIDCTTLNLVSPGHVTMEVGDTSFVDGVISIRLNRSTNQLYLNYENIDMPDLVQEIDSIQWTKKMGGYMVVVDPEMGVEFFLLLKPAPLLARTIRDVIGFRYTGPGLEIEIVE